jgi:hypothetical protein
MKELFLKLILLRLTIVCETNADQVKIYLGISGYGPILLISKYRECGKGSSLFLLYLVVSLKPRYC